MTGILTESKIQNKNMTDPEYCTSQLFNAVIYMYIYTVTYYASKEAPVPLPQKATYSFLS